MNAFVDFKVIAQPRAIRHLVENPSAGRSHVKVEGVPRVGPKIGLGNRVGQGRLVVDLNGDDVLG